MEYTRIKGFGFMFCGPWSFGEVVSLQLHRLGFWMFGA